MENPFEEIIQRLTRIEAIVLDLATLGIVKEQASIEEEFLTTRKACEFLKCSLPTLYKWRKQGFIQAHYFDKSVRFLKSDLTNLPAIKAGNKKVNPPRNHAAELTNRYVKKTIQRTLPGLKFNQIPSDFVEQKRLSLKIKREVKNQTT